MIFLFVVFSEKIDFQKINIKSIPFANLYAEQIRGIYSMQNFIQLPPAPPFRLFSFEPLLRYTQQRDFKLLNDVPYRCGKEKIEAAEYADLLSAEILLLVAVRSTCKHVARRQAIRETWGDERWLRKKTGHGMRTVFIIGKCRRESDQQKVGMEMKMHNDLLQFDLEEEMRNLTRKDLLFMQWYLRRCRHVPFVYKGDDDVFLHTENILRYLTHFVTSEEERRALAVGFVIKNKLRVTSPWSPYYVSYNLYPLDRYPDYLSGTGQIFSGHVIKMIFKASFKERIHPMDDAFIGTLLARAGVAPRHDYRFRMWGLEKNGLNWTICNIDRQFLVTFPDVKDNWKRWMDFDGFIVDEIYKVWNMYATLDRSTCY